MFVAGGVIGEIEAFMAVILGDDFVCNPDWRPLGGILFMPVQARVGIFFEIIVQKKLEIQFGHTILSCKLIHS